MKSVVYRAYLCSQPQLSTEMVLSVLNLAVRHGYGADPSGAYCGMSADGMEETRHNSIQEAAQNLASNCGLLGLANTREQVMIDVVFGQPTKELIECRLYVYHGYFWRESASYKPGLPEMIKALFLDLCSTMRARYGHYYDCRPSPRALWRACHAGAGRGAPGS